MTNDEGNPKLETRNSKQIRSSKFEVAVCRSAIGEAAKNFEDGPHYCEDAGPCI
jgi:hypothetical protein